MKTENFTSTLAALDFIDELEKKKCKGHLTHTASDIIVVDKFKNWPKKETETIKTETEYNWQVTYNEKLLEGKHGKEKS